MFLVGCKKRKKSELTRGSHRNKHTRTHTRVSASALPISAIDTKLTENKAFQTREANPCEGETLEEAIGGVPDLQSDVDKALLTREEQKPSVDGGCVSIARHD